MSAALPWYYFVLGGLEKEIYKRFWTSLLHYKIDLSNVKFVGFTAIQLRSVSSLKAGELAGKETG